MRKKDKEARDARTMHRLKAIRQRKVTSEQVDRGMVYEILPDGIEATFAEAVRRFEARYATTPKLIAVRGEDLPEDMQSWKGYAVVRDDGLNVDTVWLEFPDEVELPEMERKGIK